jgi:hypothetical protein
LKSRKVKQVLSRGGKQWEADELEERVKEAKIDGCILYSYMEIEQ